MLSWKLSALNLYSKQKWKKTLSIRSNLNIHHSNKKNVCEACTVINANTKFRKEIKYYGFIIAILQHINYYQYSFCNSVNDHSNGKWMYNGATFFQMYFNRLLFIFHFWQCPHYVSRETLTNSHAIKSIKHNLYTKSLNTIGEIRSNIQTRAFTEPHWLLMFD